MSPVSIEEQLARDIAAMSAGVVVTDSDLREAREQLTDRIENTDRSHRRLAVVGAAAAAVALVVAGLAVSRAVGRDDKTAPPVAPRPQASNPYPDFLTGSAPTPDLIRGVWRVDNAGIIMQFRTDGTVRFDEHGALYSNPVTTGTYKIDDYLITITTTGDVHARCVGTKYEMNASLPKPGGLNFVPSPKTFGSCSPLPSWRGRFEQVLPTVASLRGLMFSEGSQWRPLSNRSQRLQGDWVAEGGGYLLEMTRNGSYYVADDSGDPVDRGGWSLQDSVLTLTSSARSARCSEGDRLVLSAVDWANPGTPALRGTVDENTCGGTWTPAAWWLIPNNDS